MGGETTGTYRFLTVFWTGRLTQRISTGHVLVLENMPCRNYCIDNILVASKGSIDEHKAIVNKIVRILDKNIMSMKSGKCEFFLSETEWLGFNLSLADSAKQTLSRTSQYPKTFQNCDSFLAL